MIVITSLIENDPNNFRVSKEAVCKNVLVTLICCSELLVNIRLSLKRSCYYWCWCSALGDLIILADSSSTSSGIGLSITFKAGVELLRWLWGAIAQWSEHVQLKQEALDSIPSGYPGFCFHFQLTC